ncbi:MAG: squalene--hopene cyclase [Armatimonadota bacterium]|nr:squalene--hopene cyclase [bacterium]
MNAKTQRSIESNEASAASAVEKGIGYLLDIQHSDGYWVGELEGDTILESEYIILMRFLGRGDEDKLHKAAAYIRSKQMPNGGWSLFPGGPVDVSSSVKAYFSLKLTGTSGDEPFMLKAREAIDNAGGIRATNSYTKFYLAMLGQIPWNDAPAVPAEIMLLPNQFYFSIYEIASWSRTFVVPLTIIWARKLTTHIDHQRGISELTGSHITCSTPNRGSLLSWKRFFYTVDSAIKAVEKTGYLPWREDGVRRAEQWTLQRMNHSAGLGAIFPPIIYSIIAMRALGYEDSHPEMQRAMEELHKLMIEEDDTLRLQPCTSPVWDTAIAVNALCDAGLDGDHPAIKRAAQWIVSKEVRKKGDWQVKRPNLEPGGWYFEFANEFYPDIDDTAMVLMALCKIGDINGKEDACRRALDWLLGMQGRDGGWASFDVDNNKRIFNAIPFADHNAMLDPSTSDITARIIEMLSFYGFDKNCLPVRRAIQFLRDEQEDDGSWYGRWGVNYIYGTWQAIRGLTLMGVDAQDAAVARGALWLESVQNDDGGWGETCYSYYDPSCKHIGESSASQTAWAVMGLMCVGKTGSNAVRMGIDYLIRTQNERGTWNEEPFTGAGFPRVFYLKYHLYRHSFPLMALGMYRKMLEAGG